MCKCIGLLGRNIRNYLQRDQCLGLRYHLAHIDCYPDWHYCRATKKNQPIIEGMTRETVNHLIEIRSINLKPGRRDEFQRLYIEVALPLLKRWNFDVVPHGPSLHNENSYYVIRRFDSLAQREQSEDAYYSSDDWRLGPREAILALIEDYTDIVFGLDEVAVKGLRK
jgi:hypothetical protein